MPRWSPLTLRDVVERMSGLSPPRHRELVRGMVAELDAIDDPAERRRFALGAIAAIARLTLTGYGATLGGPFMSLPTTGRLLRRHVAPFAVSLGSLTVLLLARWVVQKVPHMSERGFSGSEIVEVLLLSLPHTLALTIPMAVFLAVSWVFTRLGAEGVLASARRERYGVRRLVAPVLGVAAVMATLTLVSNTQVVPRANARLAAVLAGTPAPVTDRTMTISELRDAARRARTATGARAAERAAAYEVEIQKKFALAAACMILALLAAATAIRFPHGGLGLVLGASGLVFTGYYVSLAAGEALADRLVISPLVAMWMANAFLLAVVLLLVRRPSRPDPTGGAETLAIGG